MTARACALLAVLAGFIPAAAYAGSGLDRVSLLYSSQVMFDDGVPLVTIMLMEGKGEVSFATQAGAWISPGPGGALAPLKQAAEWTAVLKSGRPARIVWRSIVSELPFGEKERLSAVVKTWEGRGFEVKTFVVGSVFGIGGRVYDNRTHVVTVGGGEKGGWEGTAALSSELLKKYGVRIGLHPDLIERPSGIIELHDGTGRVTAITNGLVSVKAPAEGATKVRGVEHGIGYPWHGFEDRSYSGEILIVPGRDGRLAVVNSILLPDLLRGLVPSEIQPGAHPQALRAQAVAARSEILARIGHRHPGNPYLLCAEQHCQVYSGTSREVPAASRAVRETEGEVLVSATGRIVGAVYSSNCGGHTEDNDVVWDEEADPSLRGRPDAPAGSALAWKWAGLREESKLEKWLGSSPPAWCSKSAFTNRSSLRWTKAILPAEMDTLVNGTHKIGRVTGIRILGRGASGRVTGVEVTGTEGSVHVGRELPVRKLFGGLKSGMFTLNVERNGKGEPARFVFKGGGWGHGVGMCQTGAMGMAEAGLDYRTILGHYFPGTSIKRAYAPAGTQPGR